MSRLALRALDPVAHVDALRERHWRERGYAVQRSLPPAARYLRVASGASTVGRWQGLVDAHAWLAAQVPQLLALLPPAEQGAAALALFSTMPRPLQCAVEELAYERLDVTLLTSQPTHAAPLLCLPAAHGPLWLETFCPAAAAPVTHLAPWVRALPLPLRATLGYTRLPLAQLARLALGDVLVLEVHALWLLIGERRVCPFQFTQGGLVMDQHAETNVARTADHGDIATTIEFVLHQQAMSLDELSTFTAGKVLELPADAALNLCLKVNGVAVAWGELVQLEGGLGVELQRLAREPRDE